MNPGSRRSTTSTKDLRKGSQTVRLHRVLSGLFYLAFRTSDRMADARFLKEFLETHNAYRQKHSAPPLSLNDELNASAQTWADHLLSTRRMQHSNTGDGENIFNMSSSAPLQLTGKEAVDNWYGEVKNYNWSSPGFSDKTGHFTQVVWKESTDVGVGLATDRRTAFVVAQYRPAGNMNTVEYFKRNVLEAAGGEGSGTGNTAGGKSQKNSCTML